jgi:plastocyanin
MRAGCTYIALAIASLGLLLLACSTVEAQRRMQPMMMRPMNMRPMMRPMVMQPGVFVNPRAEFVPLFYPRMNSANSYSNGGYGSYQIMPYGSSYGSNQMPNGSPYGLYASGSYSATHADVKTQADVNVALFDNHFKPKKITVPVGTTVRWTNSGPHRHTVTSDAGLWSSYQLAPGEDYGHNFTESGTYPYHCALHPQEMRGVVIVK